MNAVVSAGTHNHTLQHCTVNSVLNPCQECRKTMLLSGIVQDPHDERLQQNLFFEDELSDVYLDW